MPSVITPYGAFHTAISIIAVMAGIFSFIRYKEISLRTMAGKTYVWMTVLTCITGFFIFHHGGFGPPHVLGIITLVVLGIAWVAGKGTLGTASRYIETICYSTTFFFHMIPTITEFLTRIPAGHPIAPEQNSPVVALSVSVCFALLLGVLKYQLSRLRKQAQADAQKTGR